MFGIRFSIRNIFIWKNNCFFIFSILVFIFLLEAFNSSFSLCRCLEKHLASKWIPDPWSVARSFSRPFYSKTKNDIANLTVRKMFIWKNKCFFFHFFTFYASFSLWSLLIYKTNDVSISFGLFACKTNVFSTILSENIVKPMLFSLFWAQTL